MTLKFKWKTEFKETGIGEIPRDWEVRKIGIVAKVNEELINKNYNYKIIEYIDINSVESGLILEKKVIPLEIAPTRARRVVRNNDILLSTVRPNLRHYAFVKYSKPNTIASTGFAVIRAKNIEPRYLYYYITTDFVTEYLTQIAETHTSAYPSFTPDVVENLKTPHPSPTEQSRIATVLSWFDDLIENKKRQNEILEKVAMAIFKSWFVDFEPFKDEEFGYNEELGKEIPEGWEVRKIRELIKIESGGSAPQGEKYFTNGEYPFVRVKHLSNQPCINGYDFINDDAVRHYKLKIFKEGSIIFQKSGESLSFARVNILPFDCYVVNHLAIVDSTMNKGIGFIYCLLKNLLSEIIEERIGTALPYMKISDIQEKIILIPPQPTLQHFHSLVEPLFQKIILNQKQIMVLRKIRDALLPRLVFGKLRVVEI